MNPRVRTRGSVGTPFVTDGRLILTRPRDRGQETSASTPAPSCRAYSGRVRFRAVSPREAYFVKCDKETTTQNEIDRGLVNIVVGFAPLKPAEFVIIKIQKIAQQVQSRSFIARAERARPW